MYQLHPFLFFGVETYSDEGIGCFFWWVWGVFRYLSVLLEFHYLLILRTESTEYLSIKANIRIMLPELSDIRIRTAGAKKVQIISSLYEEPEISKPWSLR